VSGAAPGAAAGLACWCGNEALEQFGAGYRLCRRCGTLVSSGQAGIDPGRVHDEAHDLYGANYFFEHARAAGLPDLTERARTDLSERCVHWLQALLALRPPPAATLELGCASGAFVALLTAAGYAATGQDLSPAITDLARRTFGVPVLTGPIADQRIPAGSVDALILLDVLEHLRDPLGVLAAALPALREDGVVLLQLPCFDPALSLAGMEEARHPFRAMLLPDEHLFLYSKVALAQLLGRAGLPHLVFLAPMFEQYDMFVAASRAPIHSVDEPAWRSALRRSREGRIVEALVDARAAARERERLRQQLDQVEVDRARRLDVILAQQKALDDARRALDEAQRRLRSVPRWIRALCDRRRA